jgi:hypothetical protein
MSSKTDIPPDVGDLFKRDRFEQIETALGQGNVAVVRQLAMAVRAEYVIVHDGFRDAVALTLAYIAREFGPEVAENIGKQDVRERLSGGNLPPYWQQDIRQKIKAIAAGWHWHATRFSISEDDEKVTFLLHPCGSGMRLIVTGYYENGPWGPESNGPNHPCLTRSENASWSTFMNRQFPVYCNHCSEISHVGLVNNDSSFLVEGWTPARARGLCIQHTFKDIAFVPDEFYRRADLPLPVRSESPIGKRIFNQEELIDLQTHPLDKLVDCAERSDIPKARTALDECLFGWRDCIHDAYRRWLSSLWLYVHRILGRSVQQQVICATAPALIAHARGSDVAGWAGFWLIHLGLRSILKKQSGYEFLIRHEALLEPGALPCDPSLFVEWLNEGLDNRNWTDIGQFRYMDGDILHAHG